MKSDAREVWFIRHGESVANAGGVTVEASSYSLSALGFRQAEQLAAVLPEPELIIHSTYRRARETAVPAMRRFAGVPVEEWRVQELQYLDTAMCVGTTQDQRRVLAAEYWERADPDFAAPGAESFTGIMRRVSVAVDALDARREGFIHVFTHGHFMATLAWLLLTRPASLDAAAMGRYQHFLHAYIVPNCAILPLHLHVGGARTLGGLRVPPGIEAETAHTAGLVGL